MTYTKATIEEISISSNSSHLEWRAGLLDKILKGTHPRTIPARFGLIRFRGFRREDLNVKVYDVRRTDRRLWPVELKTQILKLFPFYVKNGTRYIIKLCIFLKKYFTKKIIIKSLSGTLRPLVWKRVGLQPPKSIPIFIVLKIQKDQFTRTKVIA